LLNEKTMNMVEILCPHCEGEIELDDDASGEFECPLCGGEFEWNMDDEDSYESTEYSDELIITTDFREMSAVPKVAGIAFSIWMGIVIGMGLIAMIGGLMLSSAESELGTGTSFGAIFVIISLVILAIGITGMIFGVRTAKYEDFTSLIVITIISGVLLLFYIFGFEDAADIPMIIIAAGFVIGNMCCIFVPILKAQFTGVLVTRDGSAPRKSMSNEFDKTKSVHPFEWAGHGVSLVSLIMVIVCLSSGSWYSMTVEDEFWGEELTASMGLSETEIYMPPFFESNSYSDIVDDYTAMYDDMCLESSSKDCDDLKVELDYWKSWQSSTLILKIILIITLVVCIFGLISRIAAILANTGLVNLPDKGYMVNDIIRKFSPLVSSILLFLGVVIFMIIQPGLGPDQIYFSEGEGGLGAIVWIALVFSLMVPILSKFEIDYS